MLETRTREAERAKQLAESRARDVELAQKQAEARARETQEAQKQAQAATDRAEELEKRFAELKAKQTERGFELTLNDVLFELTKPTSDPDLHTESHEYRGVPQRKPRAQNHYRRLYRQPRLGCLQSRVVSTTGRFRAEFSRAERNQCGSHYRPWSRRRVSGSV